MENGREDYELTYADHLAGQKIKVADYLTVAGSEFKVQNTYNVVFSDVNGEVGRLDFNDGVIRFEGNIEESAKTFFTFLAASFENKINEEVEARVEKMLHG